MFYNNQKCQGHECKKKDWDTLRLKEKTKETTKYDMWFELDPCIIHYWDNWWNLNGEWQIHRYSECISVNFLIFLVVLWSVGHCPCL